MPSLHLFDHEDFKVSFEKARQASIGIFEQENQRTIVNKLGETYAGGNSKPMEWQGPQQHRGAADASHRPGDSRGPKCRLFRF
jgi:hypothetical protein